MFTKILLAIVVIILIGLAFVGGYIVGAGGIHKMETSTPTVPTTPVIPTNPTITVPTTITTILPSVSYDPAGATELGIIPVESLFKIEYLDNNKKIKIGWGIKNARQETTKALKIQFSVNGQLIDSLDINPLASGEIYAFEKVITVSEESQVNFMVSVKSQ